MQIFDRIKLRNNRFRVFNYQRTKTMRYSSLLALCAFMLCLNTPEVRGEILAVHTYDVMTHTALLPKPVASDNTFSLAATWWLPDWQGSQGARGSDDIGGGDHDGNCEKNYGMHTPSNIDNRYICSKYNYNVTSSLKCHVNCRCKDEYKYTSSNCSGNYTTAGTSCEGKYNQCVCKSEFKYNSSNCSGEYEVSGTSCGGNYNGCTIRPECTVSSMSCTYGCAGYNSCDRCTSCKSNPDCDVSDKSCTYGCASYNSCSKCTSCKSNPDCSATAVSCDYGCASTNSCGICTSCSGNPDCDVTDKSCDYGCAATNSCGKCTSCKSCPPSDPCSGVSCGSNAYCSGGSCYCNSGYHKSGSSCVKDEVHSHSYSCPSGYSSSNSWGSSAQTTSKTCSCGAASGTCYKAPAHTHSYSCPSGYSATNSWGSFARTTAKVCSCGATSGTCYRACVPISCPVRPEAVPENCRDTKVFDDGCGGTITCIVPGTCRVVIPTCAEKGYPGYVTIDEDRYNNTINRCCCNGQPSYGGCGWMGCYTIYNGPKS